MSGGEAPPLDLDVEAFAAKYSGYGKIKRLRFLAQHDAVLAPEALRLALVAARAGRDTDVYRELCVETGEDVDEVWVASVDAAAASELSRLTADLAQYKADQIKESIRLAYNETAAHYYDRGQLELALRDYLHSRDYVTIGRHVIDMCLHVAVVSLDLDRHIYVENYVAMADATPDSHGGVAASGAHAGGMGGGGGGGSGSAGLSSMAADVEAAVAAAGPKLRCCSGLALLAAGKFRAAAIQFTSAPFTATDDASAAVLATNMSDALALEDVAIYGGLCALATFEREEMASQVLASPAFGNYLELVPAVREALTDFHAARYGSSLAAVAALEREASVDFYLRPHLGDLVARIRVRAVSAYVSPFTTVLLSRMAPALRCADVGALTGELASLINDGTIDGRIDVHHGVLVRDRRSGQHESLAKAAARGAAAVAEAEALTLRVAMLKANLIIRRPAPAGGHLPVMGGGADAGGGGGGGGWSPLNATPGWSSNEFVSSHHMGGGGRARGSHMSSMDSAVLGDLARMDSAVDDPFGD
ncbi:hypothetical protein BU14_0084s0016 [Porphyra umbilicalis]|uniref:PCI domain-containing protein n=1 Tax=Porphyra umbilicalis TaxID=2786 RepID=A0A1X6PEA9_PORUM|nr:hypothetical protein BU14_0084s0016 [Porphyra umbilicalis]|eukprot:OSX79202.1 hypothetical protein BU14_0084s0016 [Porphyra umbilicalis]